MRGEGNKKPLEVSDPQLSSEPLPGARLPPRACSITSPARLVALRRPGHLLDRGDGRGLRRLGRQPQPGPLRPRKKCEAINADHIRMLEVKDFTERCRPWLKAPVAPGRRRTSTRQVGRRSRRTRRPALKVLSEITDNVDFLFLPEPVFDEASWNKAMKEGSDALLRTAREKLDAADLDVPRGPSRRPSWPPVRRTASSSARRRPPSGSPSQRAARSACPSRVPGGPGQARGAGPDRRGAGEGGRVTHTCTRRAVPGFRGPPLRRTERDAARAPTALSSRIIRHSRAVVWDVDEHTLFDYTTGRPRGHARPSGSEGLLAGYGTAEGPSCAGGEITDTSGPASRPVKSTSSHSARDRTRVFLGRPELTDTEWPTTGSSVTRHPLRAALVALPDVLPVLDALAAHSHRHAVLSNSSLTVQDRSCACSAYTTASRPSCAPPTGPGCLQSRAAPSWRPARRPRPRPREGRHVGDHPGDRRRWRRRRRVAVGVWIDRGGVYATVDPPNQARRIASLSELPALLGADTRFGAPSTFRVMFFLRRRGAGRKAGNGSATLGTRSPRGLRSSGLWCNWQHDSILVQLGLRFESW